MARANRLHLEHRAEPWSSARSPYRGLRTLYIFDSPRNCKRFEVFGQLCFASCILAEGNSNIRFYLPSKPPNAPGEGGYQQTVLVEFYEGHRERWHFRKVGKRDQDREGDVKIIVKTDEEVRRSGLLLMNWMALCADRNRARGRSTALELGALMRAMDGCTCLTVQQAVRMDGVDPALMLAAIAAQLAEGQLCCDLFSTPYCLTSEIWQP